MNIENPLTLDDWIGGPHWADGEVLRRRNGRLEIVTERNPGRLGLVVASGRTPWEIVTFLRNRAGMPEATLPKPAEDRPIGEQHNWSPRG